MLKKYKFLIFLLLGLMYKTLLAYPEIPGCPTLSDADFTVEKLVDQDIDNTLAEPMKMAFFDDGEGNTNVLFTERGHAGNDQPAKLKLFSEATGEITEAGIIPAGTEKEDGATGVVLDPDFENNGWIYLYYSVYDGTSDISTYRVARYNFDGTELDMGTETLIIDIPTRRGHEHISGEMIFDDYGDLWITVGDNFDPSRSSGCADDLRGSVLRITPGVNGGYTVPEGNYAEFFGGDYPDLSAAVPPEVFAKGLRNGFTMTLHPEKRWVAWGDCGPDMGGLTEEHNLATEPGFFGYPYFVGDNTRSISSQTDPSAPVDEACTDLTWTPSIPAIYPYNHACAMTGPLYFYNRDIAHPGQMPPHFHEKWFISDFHWDEFHLITLSEDGKEILNEDEDIINNATINRSLDFKIGSDGAMYILNYGSNFYSTNASTSIYRVRYSGPEITEGCLTAAGVPETVGIKAGKYTGGQFKIMGSVLLIEDWHSYQVTVRNTLGKVLFSENGRGGQTLDLAGKVSPGVHVVSVEFQDGIQAESLVSILH